MTKLIRCANCGETPLRLDDIPLVDELNQAIKERNEARRINELQRVPSMENHFRIIEERDRLKAALESISKNSCCGQCQQAKLVAEAALK